VPNPLLAQLENLTNRLPGLSKFLKGSASSIGLDVGSASVKGVKLVRTSQGPKVVQWGRALFLPGADRTQRVQQIRSLLKALDSHGAAIVTAVGGPGTIVRSVPMPKMSPQELKTALSFEAEKHIPFKLDEVFLDAPILGELPNNRQEVLLVAARKDLVSVHLELLTLAEISPQVVDLEPVALANAWEVSHPDLDSQTIGLVHVGGRGTILNFLSGAKLQFTREIPLGGESFTQALAEGLKMDVSEAEKLKCEPGGRADEVRTAIQPSLEKWLTQCRASFDFYENQFGGRVGRLALSGGSANLSGFKEWIQETIGLPTEIWNPMAGLKVTPNDPPVAAEGVTLGVALGCALRGIAS